VVICRILCDENSRVSTENRALLISIWHMYGRVTEVCALRETQLSYNGAAKCVELQLMRTKTRSRGENIKSLFLHKLSWISCPYHATGSHLLLNPSRACEDGLAPYLFSTATLSPAKNVNALLKRLKPELQKPAQDSQGLLHLL